MKKAYRLTAAAAVFATALLMGASGGCGTTLHKANVSAGVIAATLHTAASTNHTSTLETADERRAIAEYIQAAAIANDTFIGALSDAQKSGAKTPTQSVVNAFQQLADTVAKLNSTGVLRLKSAKAQADFQLAMSTLQAQLAIIQSLVGTPMSQNHPPLRKPYAPFLSIAMTAEEVEELISLAVTAGSALVPKLLSLRGEPDAQILLNASADDAAAEQIAQSDGAAPPTT